MHFETLPGQDIDIKWQGIEDVAQRELGVKFIVTRVIRRDWLG